MNRVVPPKGLNPSHGAIRETSLTSDTFILICLHKNLLDRKWRLPVLRFSKFIGSFSFPLKLFSTIHFFSFPQTQKGLRYILRLFDESTEWFNRLLENTFSDKPQRLTASPAHCAKCYLRNLFAGWKRSKSILDFRLLYRFSLTGIAFFLKVSGQDSRYCTRILSFLRF
jgi:hypothetical protein